MTSLRSRLRRIRKYTAYAVEAVFAYLIYYFFKALPLDAASGLGGGLMRRLGPRMGISRVARQNLRAAFPDKSEEEIACIVTGMWDNLGRIIAEYPHLEKLWQQTEFVGAEHMRHVATAGGPAIFFGAHLGNWELGSLAAKSSGVDLKVVYRKPNNPFVEKLLQRARRLGAEGQIRKGAAGAKEIFKVLRGGGAVGMLVDQKLSEGLPVPFFGRPAMTATACAQFALKLGCVLYPSRVERLSGARLRITVYPPMPVVPTGDETADVYDILTHINAAIEDWIRARPEQWLWLHKRWPE